MKTVLKYRNVWDRKSPRHKWQIVGSFISYDRFRTVRDCQVETVRKWDGWPEGQVGTTRGEPDRDMCGILPLPKNADVTIVYSKQEEVL